MLFIPHNGFLKERQAKKSHAYESERVPENVLVCCQRENAHTARSFLLVGKSIVHHLLRISASRSIEKHFLCHSHACQANDHSCSGCSDLAKTLARVHDAIDRYFIGVDEKLRTRRTSHGLVKSCCFRQVSSYLRSDLISSRDYTSKTSRACIHVRLFEIGLSKIVISSLALNHCPAQSKVYARYDHKCAWVIWSRVHQRNTCIRALINARSVRFTELDAENAIFVA